LILLNSASWVTMITGMSHQQLASLPPLIGPTPPGNGRAASREGAYSKLQGEVIYWQQGAAFRKYK
jgi:hypothetical protein